MKAGRTESDISENEFQITKEESELLEESDGEMEFGPTWREYTCTEVEIEGFCLVPPDKKELKFKKKSGYIFETINNCFLEYLYK